MSQPPKSGKAGPIAAVLTLAAGLVSYYEGYVPRTYSDPIGIPTSCYGHVGPENTPGRRFSKDECQALLEGDLAKAYQSVIRCVTVPLRDYEAAALVSFTYNVGGAAFCRSTLVKRVNRGELPAACAELSKWVYAGRVKLPGLVKRRAAERATCEGR